MKEPKITIIGGGLAAIYSFWGCVDAGYDNTEIEVLYTNFTTPIGAIFMYEAPIPWRTTEVTSVLLGTCDGYAENQWEEVRETSAHKRFRNGDFPVVTEQLYSFSEMMTTLWGMIPKKGQTEFLLEDDLEAIKKKREAVICTFPNLKTQLRYRECGYLGGIPVHYARKEAHNHVVVYNGTWSIPWVRETIVPGYIFTEYAMTTSVDGIMRYESQRGNVDGKVKLVPDLYPSTPPLEWDERREGNLFRVGRLASFTPGYLSHSARQDTERFLRQL